MFSLPPSLPSLPLPLPLPSLSLSLFNCYFCFTGWPCYSKANLKSASKSCAFPRSPPTPAGTGCKFWTKWWDQRRTAWDPQSFWLHKGSKPLCKPIGAFGWSGRFSTQTGKNSNKSFSLLNKNMWRNDLGMKITYGFLFVLECSGCTHDAAVTSMSWCWERDSGVTQNKKVQLYSTEK